MTQLTQGVPAEIAQLPLAGTAARRKWDRTIRQANELYPDWSSIRIGPARFGREAYEQDYREYYAGAGGSRPRGRTARRLPLAARASASTRGDSRAH